MRIFPICAAAIVAISATAGGALARETRVDAFLDNFSNNQGQTARLDRLRRAQKAAELINAGHCDQAARVAARASDAEMLNRISETCRAPKAVGAAAGMASRPL
jgi:hypothetical protein